MSMRFRFGSRSRRALAGVHPDLARVAVRALRISEIDFVVIEGLRTEKRQAVLVKSGASQTMHSRHITGHAIDLAAFLDSQIRWDWGLYDRLADSMKQAAKELNVDIVWGGDWKAFKDGCHFELNRNTYP